MLAFASLVTGAPAADLVQSLPGFQPWPFHAYSGYLHVPGPFQLVRCCTISIQALREAAA